MAKTKKRNRPQRRIIRDLLLPYLLIGITLLALAGIRSVEMRADITLYAREISFTYLGSPTGSLIDSRPFNDLYISNINQVQVVPDLHSSMKTFILTPQSDTTALMMSSATVGQWQVARNERVSIAWNPPALTLSTGGPTQVNVAATAGTALSCDYCVSSEASASSGSFAAQLPAAATVSIVAKNAVAALTPTGGGSALADNCAIERPLFLTGPAEWPVSSIIQGTISFPSFGTHIDVNEGDFLEIIRSADLRLISMAPSKAGMKLHLTGTVRDLRLNRSRNQLPSILERLMKNQPLTLYCSAFGAIAAVLWKFVAQLRSMS